MRGHTYPDLALRYEIDLCSDSCGGSGHRRGWVDKQGVVHFDPFRKVTRAGLRRFLMLVAEAHGLPDRVLDRVPGAPEHIKKAHKLYNTSTFATKTALNDLGVRLPAYLARTDKARVRALLTGAPSGLRRSKVGRWAGLR